MRRARKRSRAPAGLRTLGSVVRLSAEQQGVLNSVYDCIEHAQSEGFTFEQIEWAIKLAWHLVTQEPGEA